MVERQFMPPTGNKSPRDWDAAMHEEGGQLAKYTDATFKELENLPEASWEEMTESILTRDPKVLSFAVGALTDAHVQQFPELTCFNPLTRYRASGEFAGMNIEVATPEKEIGEFMVQGGVVLTRMFHLAENIGTREGRVQVSDDAKEALKKTSLDFKNHLNVNLDNTQTIVDAVSMLSPFCRDKKEFLETLPRFLEKCPNSKVEVDGTTFEINPRGYSYLELVGSAPFSFLTATRVNPPKEFRGVPIIDIKGENFIDPMFIHAITKMKVATQNSRYSRHGGCPVLYPQYRSHRLIQRIGKLYLHTLQEINKREARRRVP